MNYSKLSFVFLAALATFGCTSDPKSDEAKVGEAQEVTAPAETAADYSINKDSSQVTWVGTKPTGRHDGNPRGRRVFGDRRLRRASDRQRLACRAGHDRRHLRCHVRRARTDLPRCPQPGSVAPG